ncbi:MAG: substrate-binding domain-containing protein [Acidobacteriaceae bacterium]
MANTPMLPSPHTLPVAWRTSASGLKHPPRQFKLDFIPIASERYFLLGHVDALDQPQLKTLLDILRSQDFRDSVNRLPGSVVSG